MQDELALAMQHHHAGRLKDAERLYQQFLSQHPDHARATHQLGILYAQSGQLDVAVTMIRRASVLKPDYFEAHKNLGNALCAQGKVTESLIAYRVAIAIKPDYAEAHYNLGNALKNSGLTDEAISAYRQAILFRTNYAEALNNLGDVLKNTGQLGEAIEVYRQAVVANPNLPEIHNNLGNALREKGRGDEAIAACSRAIALRPDYAQAYNNLGNALGDKGRLTQAIAAYRTAISIMPDLAEAHNNLGNALSYAGLQDEAIAAFEHAIALLPDYADAYNNLGTAFREKNDFDSAIAAFNRAISINPQSAGAYSNLANSVGERGQIVESIQAYKKAVSLDPGNPSIHSAYVLALHYHPDYDTAEIASELARWEIKHAHSLGDPSPNYRNELKVDRRIRVGYVSPDLKDHVVGRHVLPLFRLHDHQRFEISCYSQVRKADAMTDQFKQLSDRWRNIVGSPDEEVARQIREDGIDILVDLALHTADNRLLVFARKPAPVQATFSGYPGSTGLRTMDFRISDPYLDPLGMDESVYSEKTIRLPDNFWCYDPLDRSDISVGPLPAITNGFITFGCLNSFSKINDQILAIWASVMASVKGSRLLLLARNGSHRQATLDRFNKLGIDPTRVEFAPQQPPRDYFRLYHRVDIGLDSFPWNGHTTSLDSLWMGVPIVTLVGKSAVGRAGWSQLSTLGLTELAAQTPDQFTRIADQLASDLPKLQHLRMTLRSRMEQSSIMDYQLFTQNIESAYREMWRIWCDKSGTKTA